MPKLSALPELSATILVATDSAADGQRRRGWARHGQARRLGRALARTSWQAIN